MMGGYGEFSSHKLQTKLKFEGYEFSKIKIEARFHFIDKWNGSTAYCKIPLKKTGGSDIFLWTDSYDFTLTKNELSLCGKETGEGKFVSLVESVITKEEGLNN